MIDNSHADRMLRVQDGHLIRKDAGILNFGEKFSDKERMAYAISEFIVDMHEIVLDDSSPDQTFDLFLCIADPDNPFHKKVRKAFLESVWDW